MAHILGRSLINKFFDSKNTEEPRWLKDTDLSHMGRNPESYLSDSQIIVNYTSGVNICETRIYHMWSGCLLKSEFFRHYLESSKHGFTEKSIVNHDQQHNTQHKNFSHKHISFSISTEKDRIFGFETFLDLLTKFTNEEDLHNFFYSTNKNQNDRQLIKRLFENYELINYYSELYSFPIVQFLCSMVSHTIQKLNLNCNVPPKETFTVSNIIKLHLTEIMEIKKFKTDMIPSYIKCISKQNFVDLSCFDKNNTSRTELIKKHYHDFKLGSLGDTNYHEHLKCTFCNFFCNKKVTNIQNHQFYTSESADAYSLIKEFDKNVLDSLYIFGDHQEILTNRDGCSLFVHKYQNRINSTDKEQWNLSLSYNLPSRFTKNDNQKTKFGSPYIRIGRFLFNGSFYNLSFFISSEISEKRDGKNTLSVKPHIVINKSPDTSTSSLNIYPHTNFFKKMLTYDVVPPKDYDVSEGSVLFTNIPESKYDDFCLVDKDSDIDSICFKNFCHDDDKFYTKNDKEHKNLFSSQRIHSPIVDFSEYNLINDPCVDKLSFGMTLISESFGLSIPKRVLLNFTKVSEIMKHKKDLFIELPDTKILSECNRSRYSNNKEDNNFRTCYKSSIINSLLDFIKDDQHISLDDDVTMSSSEEENKTNSQKNNVGTTACSDEEDSFILCDSEFDNFQNSLPMTKKESYDTILATFTFGWLSGKTNL